MEATRTAGAVRSSGGAASDQVLYDKQVAGLCAASGADSVRRSAGRASATRAAQARRRRWRGGRWSSNSGDGGGGVGGSMPGPPSGRPTPGDPSGLLPPFFASGGGGGVDAGEDDEAHDGVSSNAGDMDQMASGLGGSSGLGSSGLKQPRSGDGQAAAARRSASPRTHT